MKLVMAAAGAIVCATVMAPDSAEAAYPRCPVGFGKHAPASKPNYACVQGPALYNVFLVNSRGKTYGRGECTDFVSEALNAGRLKPGSGYVWGRKIPEGELKKGDVIQFWNTVYSWTTPTGGTRTWRTGSTGRHTAIVHSRSGNMVTLIHQNNGVRSVTVDELNLAGRKEGRIDVYRPQQKLLHPNGTSTWVDL